jgi:ABC-2 type transport system permease protein
MARGFLRDKTALFFSIVFPLMFLVLFGGIFTGQGEASRMSIVQVGAVDAIDRLPSPTRERVDDVLEVTRTDDLDAALAKVRAGDADAAVEEMGDELVLHYSRADQVRAATVRGIFASFVSEANISASGQPATYTLVTEQVEDESLESIQYVTPGLLGWAVALNATFGSAMTLVQWRTTRLMRRLRLAPVTTGSIVAARIGVSVTIALVQMALFLGLGVLAFGLQLTGSWWMSVPILLCGTLAFMALGLLAGAVSKTAEGASGFANFITLPMAFLSGSFIPLEVAPGWIQTVSKVLPLRYLNEGMLDVLVRGEGPAAALVPMGVLLLFAVGLGLIATRSFRWDAD